MLCAQLRKDGIQVLDVVDVDPFLVLRSNCGPTGFGPVAVVVPLEKGNVIFIEQLDQKLEYIFADIRPSEVKHELIASFAAWSAGEVQYPVRVFTIQIAVRVYHLRLDPYAKIHTEGVDLVDQRLQTVGKLDRIHVPVAKSGLVA